MLLEGFLASYWIFILSPRLQSENIAYSHALSEAQAQTLASIISEKKGYLRVKNLAVALDNILLFRLPHSAKPFTKKIRLELDYDSLTDHNHNLDMIRGEKQPTNTMAIEIPLYSSMNNELIGIAHFSNNLEILHELKNAIRTKLALLAGLLMIILTGVWVVISNFNLKLQAFTLELAREKEMSKEIIDSLKDCRIILDTTGRITEVNPYTIDLFGYPEKEMIGVHISEFMEKNLLFSSQHLIEFKKQAILDNTELNFYHHNGHIIPLMLSAGLVNDRRGGFSGIVCLGKDLTRIKATEKKLQEKQVQMAHTGRLSALGEMATGIAHELNQPLYIIRLAADSIADYFLCKDKEAVEAKDVKTIISQISRADTIIKNMRSFARIDSGSITATDMTIPIEQALSFFKEQFRKNKIDLHEEFDQKIPKIIADSQKFEQIIINFLSNARYAVLTKRKDKTSYQPEVIVRLYHEPDNHQVVFEVQDNGIGMTQNETDRCFEPFFTTKKVGKGTGLGLSIVHSIVQEMNMELLVTSTQGAGTIFRILMNVQMKDT